MAITALFGFWGYWCPYLHPWGFIGVFRVFNLSFTLSQKIAVAGAALGTTSLFFSSLAPHSTLWHRNHPRKKNEGTLCTMKQAPAQDIMGSLWNLNVHVMK